MASSIPKGKITGKITGKIMEKNCKRYQWAVGTANQAIWPHGAKQAPAAKCWKLTPFTP